MVGVSPRLYLEGRTRGGDKINVLRLAIILYLMPLYSLRPTTCLFLRLLVFLHLLVLPLLLDLLLLLLFPLLLLVLLILSSPILFFSSLFIHHPPVSWVLFLFILTYCASPPPIPSYSSLSDPILILIFYSAPTLSCVIPFFLLFSSSTFTV